MYDHLLPFAETDKQVEFLNALIEEGTIAGAAKKVGRDSSNCSKVLKALQLRAAEKGLRLTTI